MLCSRITAGVFALLAASVTNASAQSCLRECEPGSVKPGDTDANLTHNAKNHLPTLDQRRAPSARSQQRLARRDTDKMLDGQKKEPTLKELRRQENQSSRSTEQAARDALFGEFVRWQVHQAIGE
jgi:hypothetical protein